MLFGSIVFGILAEVALVASLGDGSAGGESFHALQVLQFGYEFVVALL